MKCINKIFDFVSKYIIKGTIRPYVWLAFGSAFFAFSLSCLNYKQVLSYSDFQILQIICMAGIALFAGFLYVKRQLSYKTCILLIILAGFTMRLFYVAYTPVMERQHDVDFTGSLHNLSCGHLGYIMTIVNTGRLPLVNTYQMYHPPLMHLLAAVVVWAGIKLSFPVIIIVNNIQILTLFFSSASMLVSWKIIQEFRLSPKISLLTFMLVAMHPRNYIFAGSINNDTLLWTFFLICILYLLRWYQSPSMKNSIVLAVSLGLGMMTKLSAVLIAPVIAAVFIVHFYRAVIAKRKQDIKSYLLKFAVFGAISVPLGIWHPIRNYILFHQPLGYVPSMPTESRYYKGNIPAAMRFRLDFQELFANVFSDVNDYNVWVNLIKTSLFGEFFKKTESIAADVLVAVNILFMVLSVVSMIYVVTCDRKNPNRALYYVLCGIWVVLMCSYVKFLFDFPYFSTPNFRYIFSALIIGAIFIARSVALLNKRFRIAMPVFISLVCVFVLMTVVVFSSGYWVEYGEGI